VITSVIVCFIVS